MWQKKKKHYLFKGQEKETTRTYTIGGVEGGCLHATNWKRLSRFFFSIFFKVPSLFFAIHKSVSFSSSESQKEC